MDDVSQGEIEHLYNIVAPPAPKMYMMIMMMEFSLAVEITTEVLEIPMEMLEDPPVMMVKVQMMVKQKGYNDNNDQVPGDPVCNPCGSRGLMSGYLPEEPCGPVGSAESVSMNL